MMSQALNILYRSAAEEFARRLIASLGTKVDSIVLFGSVARKRATRESDIDVLVVGAEATLQDEVFDIAYEVGEASNFESYLSVAYFSRPEFHELVRLGSLFIASVLEEGVILYDDGTFSGIRGKAVAVG